MNHPTNGTLKAPTPSSTLFTNPTALQKLEGLTLFTGGIYAWFALGGSWWLFLLFMFAPDISMLGYLKSARVGAIFYNLVHSYPLAALTLVLGFGLNIPVLMFGGVLVLAHIGLDRLLGYGLKFSSSFQDTHLGNIGSNR